MQTPKASDTNVRSAMQDCLNAGAIAWVCLGVSSMSKHYAYVGLTWWALRKYMADGQPRKCEKFHPSAHTNKQVWTVIHAVFERFKPSLILKECSQWNEISDDKY